MTSWLSQISYIAETKFWNIMSSSAPQEQPQQAAAGSGGGGGGAAGGGGPPPEQVAQAVEAAKAAARFQDAADALKKQASLATDPAEREKLWRAAYMKEKEAHGESRKARCPSFPILYYSTNKLTFTITVMASGWGQGAGLAVGISSAVGIGLGNLVGVLLSGVVAVPGVLVGSGVGAIHGPWYKLKDVMSGGGGGGGGGSSGTSQENEKIKAEVGSETDEDSSSGEDAQAHMAIVDAARKLDDDEGGKQKTDAAPHSAETDDTKSQDDKPAKQSPTPAKQGRTDGQQGTPNVTDKDSTRSSSTNKSESQ